MDRGRDRTEDVEDAVGGGEVFVRTENRLARRLVVVEGEAYSDTVA